MGLPSPNGQLRYQGIGDLEADCCPQVFDEAITQKWKTEAIGAEGRDVTEKMMDWVIAELRWKAENFKVCDCAGNVYSLSGLWN